MSMTSASHYLKHVGREVFSGSRCHPYQPVVDIDSWLVIDWPNGDLKKEALPNAKELRQLCLAPLTFGRNELDFHHNRVLEVLHALVNIINLQTNISGFIFKTLP